MIECINKAAGCSFRSSADGGCLRKQDNACPHSSFTIENSESDIAQKVFEELEKRIFKPRARLKVNFEAFEEILNEEFKEQNVECNYKAYAACLSAIKKYEDRYGPIDE